MPASTAARPAQFDRANQHRRTMIAKINVARQQLNMVEDDYRQLLFDTTGRMSLKECSDAQLSRVIDALKGKGFRPVPKGGKGVARHPVALKARALWISLHHLGVVHNGAEEALEAFAQRTVGCDKMIWMRQSDGYRLIEALKDMAERNGWPQRGLKGEALGPLGLQEGLCRAILAKLKEARAIPSDWLLHTAAWRLLGIANSRPDAWTAEDYQQLAAGLGKVLRERGGNGDG